MNTGHGILTSSRALELKGQGGAEEIYSQEAICALNVLIANKVVKGAEPEVYKWRDYTVDCL